MPVISLFSGAMGLDLGLEQAGVESTLAIELDDPPIATVPAPQSSSIRPHHAVADTQLRKDAEDMEPLPTMKKRRAAPSAGPSTVSDRTPTSRPRDPSVTFRKMPTHY